MHITPVTSNTGADPGQNMTVSQLCTRRVRVHGPLENISDLMLTIGLFDRKRLSHNFLTVAWVISYYQLGSLRFHSLEKRNLTDFCKTLETGPDLRL